MKCQDLSCKKEVPILYAAELIWDNKVYIGKIWYCKDCAIKNGIDINDTDIKKDGE